MRFFWEVDLLLLVKSGFNNISYGWDIGNSVLSSRLLFPFPIPNSHFRATKQWQILPKRLWLLLELPETKTLSLLTFDRKLDAFCIVYIAIADSIWFFSKTLPPLFSSSLTTLHCSFNKWFAHPTIGPPHSPLHSFSSHNHWEIFIFQKPKAIKEIFRKAPSSWNGPRPGRKGVYPPPIGVCALLGDSTMASSGFQQKSFFQQVLIWHFLILGIHLGKETNRLPSPHPSKRPDDFICQWQKKINFGQVWWCFCRVGPKM